MFKRIEHFGVTAGVSGVKQDGALFEGGAVRFQGEVEDGVHQRVRWLDELGLRFAGYADGVFFEADALVFFHHRGAAFADDAVAFADFCGNVADFVAPGFAFFQDAV